MTWATASLLSTESEACELAVKASSVSIRFLFGRLARMEEVTVDIGALNCQRFLVFASFLEPYLPVLVVATGLSSIPAGLPGGDCPA